MNRGIRPKIGDVFESIAEAVGVRGDGVTRINNFVIFVPDVKEGDYVRVKINKMFSKMGFGEETDEEINLRDDIQL